MNTYATTDDIQFRYDTRQIGELLSDNDNPVLPDLFASNGILLSALQDASGLINSAVMVSNRYTLDDLQKLTDVDQQFLIRLTCDLAYGLLMQRRNYDVNQLPQYQLAMENLEQLREGERVFNIDTAKDAGLVQTEFPTVQTIQNVNLARDYAWRAFPMRRQQTPSR
jgi:phage gp36-like protein